MSDLFEVEVLAMSMLSSDAELLKEKSLFKFVDGYYADVRELSPAAPEKPAGKKTIEQLLGPMIDFARGGGSPVASRPFATNAFLAALVDHRAHPDTRPSPLPLAKLTLRVTEIHPQAGMGKDVSGTSPFMLALLALGTGSNPIRDHFGERLYTPTTELIGGGPPVIIAGTYGKAKTIDVGGAKRKQADVDTIVYAKWVPHLAVGKKWQTGVSP